MGYFENKTRRSIDYYRSQGLDDATIFDTLLTNPKFKTIYDKRIKAGRTKESFFKFFSLNPQETPVEILKRHQISYTAPPTPPQVPIGMGLAPPPGEMHPIPKVTPARITKFTTPEILKRHQKSYGMGGTWGPISKEISLTKVPTQEILGGALAFTNAMLETAPVGIIDRLFKPYTEKVKKAILGEKIYAENIKYAEMVKKQHPILAKAGGMVGTLITLILAQTVAGAPIFRAITKFFKPFKLANPEWIAKIIPGIAGSSATWGLAGMAEEAARQGASGEKFEPKQLIKETALEALFGGIWGGTLAIPRPITRITTAGLSRSIWIAMERLIKKHKLTPEDVLDSALEGGIAAFLASIGAKGAYRQFMAQKRTLLPEAKRLLTIERGVASRAFGEGIELEGLSSAQKLAVKEVAKNIRGDLQILQAYSRMPAITEVSKRMPANFMDASMSERVSYINKYWQSRQAGNSVANALELATKYWQENISPNIPKLEFKATSEALVIPEAKSETKAIRPQFPAPIPEAKVTPTNKEVPVKAKLENIKKEIEEIKESLEIGLKEKRPGWQKGRTELRHLLREKESELRELLPEKPQQLEKVITYGINLSSPSFTNLRGRNLTKEAKGGDIESIDAVIEKAMPPHYRENILRTEIGNTENAIFVPISPQAKGENALPLFTCNRLVSWYGGKISTNLHLKESIGYSPDQNVWERLVTPRKFEVTNSQEFKNKKIILVDDQYTTGRTLAGARKAFEKKGLPISRIITLGRGRTENFSPTSEQLKEYDRRFSPTEQSYIEKLTGIEKKYLTNPQLKIILSVKDNATVIKNLENAYQKYYNTLPKFRRGPKGTLPGIKKISPSTEKIPPEVGTTPAKVPTKIKPETKPIPKELEPLAKEARKYKSAEEFVAGINKKLNELWQKIKTAKTAQEQASLIKQQEEIVNVIKKGREKYFITPELKKLIGKKRLTALEQMAVRDAEKNFFTDFYAQALKQPKPEAKPIPKKVVNQPTPQEFKIKKYTINGETTVDVLSKATSKQKTWSVYYGGVNLDTAKELLKKNLGINLNQVPTEEYIWSKTKKGKFDWIKKKAEIKPEIKPTTKPDWKLGQERPFAFDPNSTKNEGRFRLYPPEEIKSGTYRSQTSIKSRGIEATPGVRFLLAKTKDGKSVIQTIRFNKNIMPEAKAKEWWEVNKNKFSFNQAIVSPEEKLSAVQEEEGPKEVIALEFAPFPGIKVGRAKTKFKLTQAEKLKLMGYKLATNEQKIKAHKIAREKALITPQGKTTPTYRKLAQLVSRGKAKSMLDMSEGQASQFIDILNRFPEPTYNPKTGELIHASLSTLKAIVPKGFFEALRFKEPGIGALFTSVSYYAEQLGVTEFVEKLFNAKKTMNWAYANYSRDVERQIAKLNKIAKTSLEEIARAKIKNIPTKAVAEMRELLNKYEEAPDFLIGEKRDIFNYFRALSRSILKMENEVRAKMGMPLIKSRRAYVRHLATETAQEMLAGKYPFPQGLKYWSQKVVGKKIHNPMEFRRKLADDLEELWTKDLLQATKSMLWVGLKEIHLTQPLHFFKAMMGVVTKDIQVYKNLTPEEREIYNANIVMPADTRDWIIDVVNQIIKGQETNVDRVVNRIVTNEGVKGLLNKVLAPFGRTVGRKPVTNFFQTTGRVLIHGVLGGWRVKQLLRNKFQRVLDLALYGLKNVIKSFFPATPHLKKLLSQSLFLKTYSGFEELPINILAKLEKLNLAGYQWTAISNVEQSMKAAYYSTCKLILSMKNGWADPKRTKDTPKDFFFPSEEEKLLKEMEFGAGITQYGYLPIDMPSIFRYKAAIPLTRLQSWWMNNFFKFSREALYRAFVGRPSYGLRYNVTFPWSYRLRYLQYLLLGGAILGTMGYERSFLFGAMPLGLPPTAELMLGLYFYCRGPERRRKIAKKMIFRALRAHIPLYFAYKDFRALWEGRKDLTKTLESFLFYKKVPHLFWKKEKETPQGKIRKIIAQIKRMEIENLK